MDDVARKVERYFSESSAEDVVSAYLFGSHARGTAHLAMDVNRPVMEPATVHAMTEAMEPAGEAIELAEHFLVFGRDHLAGEGE